MKLNVMMRGVMMVVILIVTVGTSQAAVPGDGPWYVATTGQDTNDCLTPATPCGTINGAIAKATSGDEIYVAAGTYTSSTGAEVVLIDKSLTLAGGWEADFLTRSSKSTIDGGNVRRGITVNPGLVVVIDDFIIEQGLSSNGGGLYMQASFVTLNRSAVIRNLAVNWGGGISNNVGALVLNASTISSNSSIYGGGGLHADTRGGNATLTFNNSTITKNFGPHGGGLYLTANPGQPLSVTLQNSLLIGNQTNLSPTSDCAGGIISAGYNIIGSSCSFTPRPGDKIDVDPQLGVLNDPGGYHPLPSNSPAINAGNPTSCTDHLSQPLAFDQRGFPRVGRCDAGAYEAGLNIEKHIEGMVRTNEVVTYTIVLSNLEGQTSLTNTVVTDTLPGYVTYNPGSFTATHGIGGETNGVITWAGDVYSTTGASLSFEATIDPLTPIGTWITNTAIASWAEAQLAAEVGGQVRVDAYFPILFNNYCSPDYFDNFNNPAGGWPTGEDSFVRYEYLGGEYRILSKVEGYLYLFRAPTCNRQNYSVEVDARWEGAPGDSSGLLFGITSGFGQYYLFDINTEPGLQAFRLLRRGSGGFTYIVPPTASPAINLGSVPNHLKVTRNGAAITLEINGTLLGTWTDGTITGLTGVGVVSSRSYTQPTSDARFDNFRVTELPDALAAAFQVNAPVSAPGASAPQARDLRPMPSWFPESEASK